MVGHLPLEEVILVRVQVPQPMKNQDLVISILISAFLISISIFFRFGLDELQKIFSIIGSFSLGVALLTYFHKKKQDELLATIDQITFFRKEIIPTYEEAHKFIQSKKSDFIISRINLETPTVAFIRENFSVNFNRQLSLIIDTAKNYPKVFIDTDILTKQVSILNLLEEFSLRVIHLNTHEHPALESIYNVFVEIVEVNAFALLYMREVQTANPIYSSVLKLYLIWIKRIRKPPFLMKGLENYGIITKKQKEDFYQMRRETKGF
ncbi:MAG: hypothetical protein JWL80_218 [Parcubacteria group bacterium]|nr:hypothetical protein [Parcubacteria group bacterium]